MRATKKLYNNLYGVELYYGKINIPKGHTCSCYMIVNQTSNPDYIHKQAMELLMAGCRDFLFLGEYSSIWKQTVEAVYNQIATDTGIFIEECEHSANFVEQLFEMITTKPFVPNLSFLIYDDEYLYEQVLNRLTYLTNQKPVFHFVRIALKEMNLYSLFPEAPADEWYKEAEHIASRITREDTVSQIASYISEELSSSFDEVFTEEECMKCAEMVKRMMKV